MRNNNFYLMKKPRYSYLKIIKLSMNNLFNIIKFAPQHYSKIITYKDNFA